VTFRAAVRILASCLVLTSFTGCDFLGGLLPGGTTPPAQELFEAHEAGTLTDGAPVTTTAPGDATSADPDRLAGVPDFIDGSDTTTDSGAAGTETAAPSDESIPVVGVDGESATPQTPGELQERITRLEAVNDSLRATVWGLVALQARLPAEGSGGGEASDSVSEGSTGEIREAVSNRARNWGLRIFFSLIFLGFAWLVIRLLGWALDRLAERSAQRRLFYKRLAPISRILLWVLAATFTALVILDVDASGLVAAGAAGGVALGFASQDILKNVFGGLIVLFDQPFQVGDKISVAGSYGEVVSIGLRSTRIVTPDDNLVTVPNAQVVDGQVANANAGELNCQVVTDLWLPGWVDEARAKEIAFQAATTSKFVFHNKPIVVLVKDEFDRVPLTHLKVKAYVLDPRYEFLFASDVTERARASFREAGLLPRERGFDPGAMDFYDPSSEARWGGRFAAHRPEGNGAAGAEAGAPDGSHDSSPAMEEES
jgi:small-conductance mechanosensitive channel